MKPLEQNHHIVFAELVRCGGQQNQRFDVFGPVKVLGFGRDLGGTGALPRGIASTERASIAADGSDLEDAAVFWCEGGIAFNANGRLFAGRSRE